MSRGYIIPKAPTNPGLTCPSPLPSSSTHKPSPDEDGARGSKPRVNNTSHVLVNVPFLRTSCAVGVERGDRDAETHRSEGSGVKKFYLEVENVRSQPLGFPGELLEDGSRGTMLGSVPTGPPSGIIPHAARCEETTPTRKKPGVRRPRPHRARFEETTPTRGQV